MDVQKLISPFFNRVNVLPRTTLGNVVVIASYKEEYDYNKLFKQISELPDILLTKTNSSGVFKINTVDGIFNLHCVSDDIFDWTSDSFSYSTLPLFSKLLKRSNLRCVKNGLEYCCERQKKGQFIEVGYVEITRDYSKVIKILGLDYEVWKNGFKNEREVFKFFCKSPYLNTSIFVREEKPNKNHTLEHFKEFLLKENFVSESEQVITLEQINEYFPEVNIFSEIDKVEKR